MSQKVYANDGIIASVTHHSTNVKTGDMLQAYFLVRSMPPSQAAREGHDEKVCGTCPLRPSLQGGCYVTLHHGPRVVWTATKDQWPHHPDHALHGYEGKPIRLGAYGDPGAVPASLLHSLVKGRRWTGYTHQWRSRPHLKRFCMASVEGEREAREAQAKGYRTYRIVKPDAPLMDNEILCPNTTHNVQCKDCLLCDGARKGDKRKSIAIHPHGASRKKAEAITETS